MIIRSQKNKNYTTMNNVALNDINLSLKAKGLYAYLMSKPDGWKINSRGLESQLKEGRDAILAALSELEEVGYLVRGQVKEADGKFSQGDATLYENLHERSSEVIAVTKAISPRREKPYTEKPTTKVITDLSNTTNVVAEAGETNLTQFSPKKNLEAGNSSIGGTMSIRKLYYLVIKKYSLPTRNHTVLEKQIKTLEEEIGVVDASRYLAFLLENDYTAIAGDFKPELTNSGDIYIKRIQVREFLTKNWKGQQKSQQELLEEFTQGEH